MKKLALILASLAAGVAAPAYAAETIAVPFTTPDGGVSIGLYSGIVQITVSGTGFSNGASINDAFYKVPSGALEINYFQLAFGLSTLTSYTPSNYAKNFIVGAIPVYNLSHIYTFFLDTGTSTPSILHFGVADGNFSDNGGAYSVTVTGAPVPEPTSWALMLAGFGMIGFAARRRSSVNTSAITYA